MSLDARVVVDRAGHRTDVSLAARRGDVVAVVGPNGAGKSTLLHGLAGLLPLDDGHVAVDGIRWTGPVPSRDLGVVFQARHLFPHLSARQNVAFGLRTRGWSRRDAATEAQDWLDRLGVGDLGDRRPAALSGGQAQRVAIARALAPRPALLLLDEP
ncbi:MAG: ATP-binding cassette domain-containing protein, partial [Nocardioides sp.]|nr:ATP-binding cassette domain-containing protein [Nocardioides sp.]